jgi:hypothetical protein
VELLVYDVLRYEECTLEWYWIKGKWIVMHYPYINVFGSEQSKNMYLKTVT